MAYGQWRYEPRNSSLAHPPVGPGFRPIFGGPCSAQASRSRPPVSPGFRQTFGGPCSAQVSRGRPPVGPGFRPTFGGPFSAQASRGRPPVGPGFRPTFGGPCSAQASCGPSDARALFRATTINTSNPTSTTTSDLRVPATAPVSNTDIITAPPPPPVNRPSDQPSVPHAVNLVNKKANEPSMLEGALLNETVLLEVLPPVADLDGEESVVSAAGNSSMLSACREDEVGWRADAAIGEVKLYIEELQSLGDQCWGSAGDRRCCEPGRLLTAEPAPLPAKVKQEAVAIEIKVERSPEKKKGCADASTVDDHDVSGSPEKKGKIEEILGVAYQDRLTNTSNRLSLQRTQFRRHIPLFDSLETYVNELNCASAPAKRREIVQKIVSDQCLDTLHELFEDRLQKFSSFLEPATQLEMGICCEALKLVIKESREILEI